MDNCYCCDMIITILKIELLSLVSLLILIGDMYYNNNILEKSSYKAAFALQAFNSGADDESGRSIRGVAEAVWCKGTRKDWHFLPGERRTSRERYIPCSTQPDSASRAACPGNLKVGNRFKDMDPIFCKLVAMWYEIIQWEIIPDIVFTDVTFNVQFHIVTRCSPTGGLSTTQQISYQLFTDSQMSIVSHQ